MSKAFKSISKGLMEAAEYSKGKTKGAREFKAGHIDVRKLRDKIEMSQPQFAASFGISLGTLRHWERGDRYPQGPALVLLNLLSKDPDTVLRVLHGQGKYYRSRIGSRRMTVKQKEIRILK